jgi:molybdopterin-guanine dinucleotide biosynthesis protein A
MEKLSLMFPMAGRGARFGYKFKPFLEVQGRTFIEAAVAPFRPFLGRIGRIHFIYLREQDQEHRVGARLARMFADVPFTATILETPTEGPAETLIRCLDREAISGPAMVCDCDHAVEVRDLVGMPETDPAADCAVPTWDLTGEAISAWSVAAVRRDGRVTAIAEKAYPREGDDFRGVIGCYYFARAEQTKAFIAGKQMIYLSDVVREYIETGHLVRSVPVSHASFFGDPARLASATGLI